MEELFLPGKRFPIFNITVVRTRFKWLDSDCCNCIVICGYRDALLQIGNHCMAVDNAVIGGKQKHYCVVIMSFCFYDARGKSNTRSRIP